MQTRKNPAETVVVIGAGPTGLAAAAHLVERGITPVVMESGDEAGAAIRQWGHVRLFSPWQFNIDTASRRILVSHGWQEPDPAHLPTGTELVDQYLAPLAATPELAPHIQYRTHVVAVSRQGVDLTRTIGREHRPYLVRSRSADGSYTDTIADAVIDASGTWGHSNPLGAHGLAAPGENASDSFLTGPLPDVLGKDRARFAGKRTLVVGMGHSAANTLLALADLAEEEDSTSIVWAIRGGSAARLYGGGDADALPARGKLGTRLKKLVADGKLTLVNKFTIDRFTPAESAITVHGRSADQPMELEVDHIVAATGFRPNLEMLRETRLDIDPGVEAPSKLAPLIDPNFHSCGTVPPHGEKDLAHPDEGIYLVGMKSYGRAPTFLMATGYEQVRSVAAALAGDRVAADRVQLELPETGVCSSSPTVENADGSVTFADTTGSCGTDEGGCGTAPAPKGLSTGVLHGYSGEPTTVLELSEARPRTSCCGSSDANGES
ncbi:NAD(P)-binding domain-containing protein [Stackebrandtia soli]|uniref:NAD(P)-binding domain-containing protein n=1 Tax=Stackebrandtia soli TaxID=1892856 RepID=UPI0039EBAF3E